MLRHESGIGCMLLVTVLLALAIIPPQASAELQQAQASALNPELMGMVIRDPYYDYDSYPGVRGPNISAQDEMGRQLANIGVRWVRLEFITDPGGQVNFEKYDYFIKTVAPRHNFKVLGLIANGMIPDNPADLNTQPDTKSDPKYGGGLNDYMIHWLNAALRIAERYGGTNGRVHAFEIFNEPNRLFGDGTNLPAGVTYSGLDPVRVARLHAKFYRICKNTDGSQASALCPADTQMIVGGLHPKGTSAKRSAGQPETIVYTDEQYLQRMYQTAFTDFKNNTNNSAPWRGEWPVEGIGYHPYPEEIEPRPTIQTIEDDIYIKIIPRLNQMRTMLIALNDPQEQFWITEVGYNVGYYEVRGPTANANQAEFMRQLYIQLALRSDIANVFWFKYEDFPPANVVYDSKGKPVADPQQWGVVHIPFTEGGSVNGIPCAGGACYEPNGKPDYVRPSYLTYRELAGLPVLRSYLPMVRK